jgi:CRISPR system Cascade subunit CasD
VTVLLKGVPICLFGPMQAWGGPSVGDNRATLPFPSRSGVLGLVAACLGIRRVDVDRLVELSSLTRVHIRVDAPGTPLVDDQTIQGNPRSSPTRQTIQSKRTYLCDAAFVAIVVCEPPLIAEIAKALQYPVFSPSLGRRTCVPTLPLFIVPEVRAEEPIALFDQVALIGSSKSASQLNKEVDYYLDVDDHQERLRRIPVRDLLTGPLPRQWRERFATHVRMVATTLPSSASLDDVFHR